LRQRRRDDSSKFEGRFFIASLLLYTAVGGYVVYRYFKK
jgi:hypothetical protein